MDKRVAVAAAMLAVGVTAGCSQTVTGTVAMTTEPGFSAPDSTRSPRTSSPRTTSPRTPRTSPGTPPSGDAATLTCEQYQALTPEEQSAAVQEILAGQFGDLTDLGELGPILGGEGADGMRLVADALCQMVPPDVVLSEVLLGGSPP
ncbi:hypothetical protein [Mycolicibacterium grossiae]|nr:hypothetical protein [Mycolicibacterium grossiae]QEM44125.1 hypothetical protein FZ046_04415 [Mycolicibacterium grossiae]